MVIKRLAGIVPLAGLILLTSCGQRNKNAAVAEEEVVAIEAVEAATADLDRLETFTATVEAEMSNQIAPQTAGRIKKIYVEVGDRVHKGRKLAEMDDVNLKQTRLQLENHKIEFERVDELYKVGGISKSTWDARKLEYELSQKTYDNLLENTLLLSPIDGIVTKRNYDSGDMFTMGDPIFVVEKINPVKLIVNISESLFTKVKQGAEIKVTIDVYGDEVFLGYIKLVHPTIDKTSRTFPVEIQLKNNDQRIRPGMFARATFNYGSENCVMIPDKAVQKLQGAQDQYVYVYENGKVSYRRVTLGSRVGDQYEVIEGLSAGESVATTGLNRLKDGISVTLNK